MAREIKFRAWDYDANVMIHSNNDDGDYWWEFRPIRCGYIVGEIGGNSFEPPEPLVHYYEDIMQFTGLTDKNGKEIYEGDIINDDGLIMKIEFVIASFCKCNEKGNWIIHSHDQIEVIGNIYENPELL
jgi:hypothetical protein